MMNINFNFCPFSENLTAKVLSEQQLDDTVLIFPTENSKRSTIRQFQRKWEFQRIQFLTMEELKTLLFVSDKPLLKEAKRTIVFYASLKQEDKIFFKINNYFQSLELAIHFFDLFEEFNEELVNEQLEKEQFAVYNAEISDWQFKTYQRLLNIRLQYQDFIHSKNFNDIIFLHKPQFINLQSVDRYKKFVFVNQFYYTELEKEIIKILAGKGKQVTIYYQLPADCVDTKNLTIKPFSLKDFTNYRTQSVRTIECKNDFSMITSLIEQLDRFQIRDIVDVFFLQNTYSRFLALSVFKLGASISFTNTSIYRFFTTLHHLIDSLIWESSREKILLPLQVLLDAILVDDFFLYFLKTDTKKVIQEQTLNYLYSLIDEDYKYVDLDQEFFLTVGNRPESEFIKPIIDFINHFIEVQSITDLIAKIDSPIHGVQIKNIISKSEHEYTNILDAFYRLLSDFSSIENLDLVNDWGDYFSIREPQLEHIKIASGILKLFTDYMKFKFVHYHYDNFDSSRIEITNFLDTRNINYNQVAILNVVEGKIPSARQLPFLFTERQRKLMHLKTYEDIKLREKYYFLRLVLTSTKVYLFTQKNIEQNIEVSSLLEEIKLYFPSDKIELAEARDQCYGEIYQSFLDCDRDYEVDQQRGRESDFFKIPLDVKSDFKYGALNLTPYALKELKENPFVYYIRQIADVTRRKKEVDTDFSVRLIGNFVHVIMSEIWRELIEVNAAPVFGYDFSSINEEFIGKVIVKVLQRRQVFYYHLPHNHTLIYFNEILLPVIRSGIVEFFRFLDKLNFSHKNLHIISEKDFAELEERKHKRIFAADDNALNLEITIRGRADLRIELPDENRYFIFDYKTGGYDKEQLIIYELFYHLLDQPELLDRILSYFFQVLSAEHKELSDFYRYRKEQLKTKTAIIEQFKEELLEIMNQLEKRGFALPERKSHLDALPEITRKDLYLTMRRADNM